MYLHHLHLQVLFVERAQALLHGDLHTGSLLVTPDTTHVIDAGACPPLICMQ